MSAGSNGEIGGNDVDGGIGDGWLVKGVGGIVCEHHAGLCV